MLTIRLQRTGGRNKPDFRIVLAEKHRAANKKVLEVFGQYNPRTKNIYLSNEELLKEWVGKNVEISPTVRNLLVSKKLIEGAKVRAWRPKKKAQEVASSGAAPKAESVPAAPATETPAAAS